MTVVSEKQMWRYPEGWWCCCAKKPWQAKTQGVTLTHKTAVCKSSSPKCHYRIFSNTTKKHSLTLSKAATPYLIWSVMICSNQRLLLLLTSTTQNGQKTNKLHRYEHLILKHMFKIRLCVLHSDWLKLITYWLEFNNTFDLTRDASFVSLNHQRSRSLKQKKRGKPFQKTPFVHHWLTLNHQIKEPYDVVAGS